MSSTGPAEGNRSVNPARGGNRPASVGPPHARLASGEITEAEAERYREALEEAFTFRITWDGEEATPTSPGLSA